MGRSGKTGVVAAFAAVAVLGLASYVGVRVWRDNQNDPIREGAFRYMFDHNLSELREQAGATP
jgi:predicted negative regulator of RcsB-dependent stress response